MQIYGLDFTSAPSRKKPITCVSGNFSNNTLQIDHLLKLASLNEFEVFLKRRGPWVAGFDFPFGQPEKLIDNLGWPKTWPDYVEQVAAMTQQKFEETLADYRQSRPIGDKHHLRATDAKAKALSPMMLHGIPVGKMFFRGAPRILRSEVSILPCHPTDDNRIALEVYPALAARKWLGKRSYKSDDSIKQTAERETARRDLITGLQSSQLKNNYGFSLETPSDLINKLIQDPTADSLDALLCAVQAAWAYAQQHRNYGIPPYSNPLEGWIVDPETRTGVSQ